MTRPFALAAAVCTGALSLLAAAIGERVGAGRALFGVVATASVATVAFRSGAFGGVASAIAATLVFAGGALIGVPAAPVSSACVGAALIAFGWISGRSAQLRRQLADAFEEEALLVRRELYRMKKEAGKVSRGTVRSTAPPEAPAPKAPTIDAAAFAKLVSSISGALNEDRLVEALTVASRDACAASDATMFMLDRRADRVQPGKSADGRSDVPATEIEPLARLALKTRGVLARVESDATTPAGQAFETAGADAAFAAPLFDRQLSAGVLVVRDAKVTPADAKAALTAISAVGGLALANARLGRQSEQSSRTDPLTGLPNTTAVREVLDEKLARGVVSVLLLAADGIHEVNQAYGRRAGDKTIAALARLVALEVGADGIVGYGGGATLLVIVPGRRGEPVRVLAERLLRRVPSSVTAGPEGIARPLTISIGSASASVGPADGLLAEAEKALALAAGNGGNRLVEASTSATANARA